MAVQKQGKRKSFGKGGKPPGEPKGKKAKRKKRF